jgi:AraC-like DNA-binding protein
MQRSGIIILFFLICQTAFSQVTFIVEGVPTATQSSDTIYLTGTFNNWVPNDPRYALKRQLDGHLAVTVEITGRHEYKLTRGSWTKVETNSANQYTANRTLDATTDKIIYVSVENWLDLGGAKNLNYWIFYYFACAFQGIALCLLVHRTQKRNKIKFKKFLTFNIALVGLYLLVILQQTTNQIWQSYITFFFHIAFFLWAPVAISFIDSIGPNNFRVRRAYVIPVLLVAIFILCRVMNMSWLAAISGYVTPALSKANTLIILSGVTYNAILYARYLRTHRGLLFTSSSPLDVKNYFFQILFWNSSVPLVFIVANIVLLYSGVTGNFIEDFQMAAVAFSPIVFIQAYFYWKYPELIKEEKLTTLPSENFNDLARKLQEVMETQKPYKNVDLNISELAELVGTKPHQLSRVINDHHQKNFRDFVNSFRIREFISLAGSKEFKHYTFLALAQEVGFNSKSTFNLAFKKQTNLSPREYFKKSLETTAGLD